jgi:hypothetical protein
MNDFESSPNRSKPINHEANIRDLIDKKGVSFDEARATWEMMREKSTQEKLEKLAKLQDPEREEDNE